MSFGVFISVGIIGTAGVAHRPAIDVDGFEFADGRRWMTDEAIAAIEGARAAGAGEIVLGDAHPGGLGLLLDKLPRDIRVIRSWPRVLGQMHGIDTPGLAACVMIGHHAGAASWGGLLAQSFSAEAIRDIRLDGVSQSETGIDARVAGQFGVPLVFASGDSAYVAEVAALVPGIGTVTTKRDTGHTAAITRTPAAACADIRTGVEAAVARRSAIAPLTVGQALLEIEFVDRVQPELLALIPGVERTGPFTIAVPRGDIIALRQWITFVTSYLPAGLRRY